MVRKADRIARRDIRYQNLKGGGLYILKRHPRDDDTKGHVWRGHLRMVCFNEDQTLTASYVMTRIEARRLIQDIKDLLGDNNADTRGQS